MTKHKASSFLLYAMAFVFIAGWWYIVFKNDSRTDGDFHFTLPDNPSIQAFTALAPLDRKILHQALSGDIALMTQLIADWDIDAQLLSLAGHEYVKRLSPQEYLRSQVLGRQIMQRSSSPSGQRILPQTYVAASYLLALVDTKQIVALPKGLRQQTELFPLEVTNKICLDIDHYNAETLHLAQPEIAFIAHYSHPALIQALKNQGTQLFTLKGSNTLDNIYEEIKSVGATVNQPLKAELLALFMEAAMQAIDNRLILKQKELQSNPAPRILFVNYHSQYSLPTKQTLTGQLLKRLGISNECPEDIVGTQTAWTVPLNREQIARMNPQGVIIATSKPYSAHVHIANDSALSDIAAFREKQVFFLDETVQQFPSQYLVLAYFDIAQALLQMNIL